MAERDRWDVVVLGGGPAGCAAALGLRARTPSLSVLLVEATAYDRPRAGEMLPAAARSLLVQLGVFAEFAAESFLPAFASAAAWGSAQLREHHFLFSARGHGWHLDRARFDAMLARAVERRGARVLRGTRLVDAERDGEAWQWTLSDGARGRARFIVDATGRAAALARSRGAVYHKIDALTGFTRFVPSAPGSDPRTLVEAFADGWWYTAPLPGDIRVISCMTDVDVGRTLGLPDPLRWRGLLGETVWIKETVADAHALELRALDSSDGLMVRACDSKVLAPMSGEGWLATGDSAMAFDPLSSQGITKALRSGLLASYAVGDCLLTQTGPVWSERYEGIHRRELLGYLTARRQNYREERRFSDREVWRRRHGEVTIP